jgi:hypothetical protein
VIVFRDELVDNSPELGGIITKAGNNVADDEVVGWDDD